MSDREARIALGCLIHLLTENAGKSDGSGLSHSALVALMVVAGLATFDDADNATSDPQLTDFAQQCRREFAARERARE